MLSQRSIRFSCLLLVFLHVCEAIRITPTTSKSDVRDLFAEERNVGKIVDVTIPDSPDGHLVASLPLLDPTLFTTKQWAGHLPASDSKDKYFFYWLFAPDMSEDASKQDRDIPLVIWLNGGPACSSMDGLFIENGPFVFDRDQATNQYKLVPNDKSWHKLPAYTLYIDQPVGTGLSFTTSAKYPRNDAELNRDFYYFLQQFLRFHGDKFVSTESGMKTLNRKLYFSGESYAGHYNVIFSNHILKQNKAVADGDVSIPLGGAAIGNGWVDPYYQYAGAEAAYGHGLIGTSELAAFDKQEKVCQSKLAKGNYNVNQCFALIDDIVSNSHGKSSSVQISSYDIRITENKEKDRDFPPGHKIIENYLGNKGHTLAGKIPAGTTSKALKALHAEAASKAGQKYLECTDPPYYALSDSDGKGVVPDMVEVLEHPDEVEFLFFNGIMDMVCNHVGNERSLSKLPWKYNSEWNTAPRYAWKAPSEVEGKVSGYMREFKNLKFLKINDAGHMVPLDVPGVAFDMMKNFVYGKSFQDSLQDLKRSEVTECPVCPECPDGSDARTSSTSSDRGGGVFISTSWLLVVLVVGTLAGSYFLASQRRRRQDVLERANVRNYDDVELRDVQYSDQPDDKEENGVI